MAAKEPVVNQKGRYDLLWAFWTGAWRADLALTGKYPTDPWVYSQSRQLWSMARSIVRLYAQTVYQGDLSTDGNPLEDSSLGAIPVTPQIPGSKKEPGKSSPQEEALRTACAELWTMWNWRLHMSTRPKFGAILGDVLTELVEDVDRAQCVPRSVWPGYVKDLRLDLQGNVKRYALEYQVVLPQRKTFGEDLPAEDYLFRKEVDGKQYRYYKDNDPWTDLSPTGHGEAVQDNPYGFCPAIWDRHELIWGDRGMGAFEAAMIAAISLNSTLSHALDYQSKQFSAPVGVEGWAAQPAERGGSAIILPNSVQGRIGSGAKDGASQADGHTYMRMRDGGKFHTVDFDVGRTAEMAQLLIDGIGREFPESNYAQQILEMTQLTAPGVERALGPVVGQVRAARAAYDPNTIKLHQMAISIITQRLAKGEYPADKLTVRYDAFKKFNEDSWASGELDFVLPDREVIPESRDERVDRLLKIEKLTDEWSLLQAGVPKEVVDRMMQEKEEEKEAMDEALTGVPAPGKPKVPGQPKALVPVVPAKVKPRAVPPA